jgi:hypothetical protein
MVKCMSSGVTSTAGEAQVFLIDKLETHVFSWRVDSSAERKDLTMLT